MFVFLAHCLFAHRWIYSVWIFKDYHLIFILIIVCISQPHCDRRPNQDSINGVFVEVFYVFCFFLHSGPLGNSQTVIPSVEGLLPQGTLGGVPHPRASNIVPQQLPACQPQHFHQSTAIWERPLRELHRIRGWLLVSCDWPLTVNVIDDDTSPTPNSAPSQARAAP